MSKMNKFGKQSEMVLNISTYEKTFGSPVIPILQKKSILRKHISHQSLGAMSSNTSTKLKLSAFKYEEKS
jgi:hypothetical protein